MNLPDCARCEDPFPSTPVEALRPDQWDEFDHFNSLAVDQNRISEARAAERKPATTTIPAARSAT